MPAWAALAHILTWFPLFYLGLKLRTKAARLSMKKLSRFLCNVLISSLGSMAPLAFFTFNLCLA